MGGWQNLEEPLVLCDHHLNHGGKSGSNGNVHWVVDRFQLPKLDMSRWEKNAVSRDLRLRSCQG